MIILPKSTGSHSGTLKKVTWKSSNTSVATVSSSGLVTGKSSGTAVITATIHGKTAACTVTVKAKDWKSLYYDFLKKAEASFSYKEGNQNHTAKARSFYLLHLNNDTIPELVVSKKVYSVYGQYEDFMVFTVKNSKVVYAGSTSKRGFPLRYSEKYKAIISDWWTNPRGGAGEALYIVKDGKLVQSKYAFSYIDGEEIVYKIGDTESSAKVVSESASKEFRNKYFNSKDQIYATDLRNTESVRLKQFK